MDKLKSRKLWLSVIAAALVIANQGLGLNIPQDSVLSFAGIIMSYILGQSFVDGKAE